MHRAHCIFFCVLAANCVQNTAFRSSGILTTPDYTPTPNRTLSHQVIHRDLKPANILIMGKG
jgi:serine/threonine protein kinase